MKIDVTFYGELVSGGDDDVLEVYYGDSCVNALYAIDNFVMDYPSCDGEIDIRVNEGVGWFRSTRDYLELSANI